MTCRMETPDGAFNITIEEDEGPSFLVTRRIGTRWRGAHIRPHPRAGRENGPQPGVPAVRAIEPAIE